ncbi:MAG: tetratricopeptide repeat protein [Xanthomonadales bacterium]|nr:tetratricopeptide repeat protein [Xanthomonadales bacterium]
MARRTSVAVTAATLLLLGGCAARTPAPGDARDVENRVREPARQDRAGVQVRPLQNPAVKALLADAGDAESAGDYDQAVSLLERALRIQPNDPEILQNMAEVQLRVQDYEQALHFAQRSYDIGPRVGEICSRNWRTISVARDYMGDPSGSTEAEQRASRCMNTPPTRL